VFAGLLLAPIPSNKIDCPSSGLPDGFSASYYPINKCVVTPAGSTKVTCSGGLLNMVTLSQYSDSNCAQSLVSLLLPIPDRLSTCTKGYYNNFNYLGWVDCSATETVPSVMQDNSHLEFTLTSTTCPSPVPANGFLVSVNGGSVIGPTSAPVNCSSTFLNQVKLTINSDGSASVTSCSTTSAGAVVTITDSLAATKSGCSTAKPQILGGLTVPYQIYMNKGLFAALSAGAIVGIVIGVVVFVALVAYCGWSRGWFPCWKKQQPQDALVNNQVCFNKFHCSRTCC
jgi:hypothetical protein